MLDELEAKGKLDDVKDANGKKGPGELEKRLRDGLTELTLHSPAWPTIASRAVMDP